MLVGKKESRYNAYMKRTDSGIIVKTVDSVTGVESLIKFTSDKIVLPGERLGNDPPKENIRPIVKKSNEVSANPHANKKKRYSLSKRNPKIITKLSNPRPLLKELHQNVPDFNVYEDSSSSTSDFQNPKVVFVANSKLAKDSVVNLSIPGKLANVCYNGDLSENGVVKFKAKSVIKPFTIVIGNYVINVNICHNLTSVKDMQNPNQIKIKDGSIDTKNPNQLKNKDGSIGTKNPNQLQNKDGSIDTKNPNQLQNKDGSTLSNYNKENRKPVNKEQFTDVREVDIESKTNEIKFDQFTEDCRIQIDDETAVISDSPTQQHSSTTTTEADGRERRISSEKVESAPHVDNNKREKVSELLTSGLESNPTETENSAAGECSDKSYSEENNNTEEIKTKLSSSVVSTINKFNSLSNQSSTNVIKTEGLNPDSYNNHILQNVNSSEKHKTLGNNSSIRDCLSSVSNCYAFPDDLKCSKVEQSCFSRHSVVGGFDTNNLSVHRNFETERLGEFDNGHTVEENYDKRPNSRCSNTSMLEIKKKLSEATTSLHKLCSVIESIENLSEKSVSEGTVGLHHMEISCESLNTIMQGRLNKANSNSSTIVIRSGSDESYPRNKSNMNTSYKERTNRFKNKNYVYQACDCENIIQATYGETAISKETEDYFSNEYRTSNSKEQSNDHSLCLRDTFGEINYVLPLSKKIEPKNINTMEKAGNTFSFDGRRQVQSLSNLSESNIPCVDNVYGAGGTSNCASTNYQTETTPNVLCRTKYVDNLQTGEPQGGKISREFPGKIKRSCTIMEDRVRLPVPTKYVNDNVSSLATERSYTTCLRYNKELDSGTNLGQESHTSDSRINSYSTNSIRTIYIKPDCTSSNNLTIPIQHSSMRMFIDDKDTNRGTTNDLSLTNSKPSCREKVSKSNFSQKMKQKLSKLKTHLWNFGTVSNRNESDLTQLSENSKSNELGIASCTNNVTAENEENLYFAGKSDSLIDLNDDGVRGNIHHDERDSNSYPDFKFTSCKTCSQILSEFEAKSPYTLNSTQNRFNFGLLRNRDKLDANCTIDPSDIFLQFSEVSFKK